MRMKTIIGLEVHIQLNTKTKLFCSCPNLSSASPNTIVCVICLGMPGSKPLVNKEALVKGIQLGMALGSDINSRIFFSRKTYFYPDMSKNYQITQYEAPTASEGSLSLDKKTIRIRRLQVEEDPASLVHEKSFSLIDYNRSGTPLIELVTEPDFNSVEEVSLFLEKLQAILDYLNIHDVHEGSLRVDVNVNIEGHPRVEIKNVTGMKSIEKAILFELVRQKLALKSGKALIQETRHFDAETGKTLTSRSKETEADYGYILEGDIPLISFHSSFLKTIHDTLPELPERKMQRFQEEFGIDSYQAFVVCLELGTADLFELLVQKFDSNDLANWISGPLRKVLNYNKKTFVQTKISSEDIFSLLSLQLPTRAKEMILRSLIEKREDPEKIAKKLGYSSLSEKELEKLVEGVLKNEKEALASYKKGEEKALNFLVGQVISTTQGAADPKKVRAIFKRKLE